MIALGTVYNLAPRINLFLNLAHDMNQWSRLDDIPSNINYEDYMDICLGLIENNPDIAALIDCEEEYQKSINESQYSGKNNVSGIKKQIIPKDWKKISETKLPFLPNKLLIFEVSLKIKLGSSGE